MRLEHLRIVHLKKGPGISAELLESRALKRAFPGSFQVVLETKNKSANEAIAMILQQMRRIQESPVSDAEMESARKFLIGSFPLKLDTQNSIVQFMLQVQLYGLGLDYIDRYPGYIRAVTKEDVQKVARQYLHPDNYILVAVANQSVAGIKVASNAPRPASP